MIAVSSKEVDEESDIDAPNLLPLLDILFMLIVFFLLTANSFQQILKLDLLVDGVQQARPLNDDQPVKLYLFAGEPRWQLNDKTLFQWSDVERNLQENFVIHSDRKLVIISDRNTPIERFLQLFAFLKQEGRSAAQILMKSEEEK